MIYQLHRSASARIAGTGTAIVSYYSLVEIGSLAGIVGAVTAAKDVDVIQHAFHVM